MFLGVVNHNNSCIRACEYGLIGRHGIDAEDSPTCCINYQSTFCEVTYTPVYKFGQSHCVIAERRFCEEEDTKACYSAKAAPHKGWVPGACPEFADSKI